MSRMRPCPECRQHVAVDAESCPFCAKVEASDTGSARSSVSSAVATGLVRTAGSAAGAAHILGAAGCYESHYVRSETDASAPSDAAVDVPLLDAPRDTPIGTDAGTPPDASVADAAAADVGPDTGPDASPDAGPDGDISVPLYGGIFPDPRQRAVV